MQPDHFYPRLFLVAFIHSIFLVGSCCIENEHEVMAQMQSNGSDSSDCWCFLCNGFPLKIPHDVKSAKVLTTTDHCIIKSSRSNVDTIDFAIDGNLICYSINNMNCFRDLLKLNSCKSTICCSQSYFFSICFYFRA